MYVKEKLYTVKDNNLSTLFTLKIKNNKKISYLNMRKRFGVDGESKTSRTVYLQQRYTIDISTVEVEERTDEILCQNQSLLSYNMERNLLGGNTQNKVFIVNLVS